MRLLGIMRPKIGFTYFYKYSLYSPNRKGFYHDEGLTKVRTAEEVVRHIGTSSPLTNPLTKHRLDSK